MKIIKLIIKPTYIKDSGVSVTRIDASFLPADFCVAEQSVVSIPPKQIAGNHKHRRQEAFISTSKDLVLYWIDTKGERHEENMVEDNCLLLFIIPSYVPHAVKNNSLDTTAFLYEFANGIQQDVEASGIIS